MSEASTVRFKVERLTTGRKSGKKCKPHRRTGRKCQIVKTLRGSFSVQGAAGANHLKFSGRLNKKSLHKGKYRLVALPTDVVGNVGAEVRARFEVKR